MRTFFISDTHFGHKNIIKYENRPFSDTAEMDKEMIKRWNNVVSNEDTVWFLGDLCFGNRTRTKEVVSQLHGHKMMVMGNHDYFSPAFYMECGFEYATKYPIVLKQHFILSHIPMEQMNTNDGYFYIYGHVHGDENFKTATSRSRCVCCERQNYFPIEIPEFNEYQASEKNADAEAHRHI